MYRNNFRLRKSAQKSNPHRSNFYADLELAKVISQVDTLEA